MEQDKRCAMLDADFISKLYESNQMIVRILSIADFNFVCHKQTSIELSRHNHQALQWLNTNTDITVYSDRDLIQQMLELFNISAYTYYADMLRRSCDIFLRASIINIIIKSLINPSIKIFLFIEGFIVCQLKEHVFHLQSILLLIQPLGHIKPIPKVYKGINSALARDNLENDIPNANLQD